MAMMRFIPEVVWHAGIRAIPLERLYDTVLECFDWSGGRPVTIPKTRSTPPRVDSRSESSSWCFEPITGCRLEVALIDRLFGNFDLMHWQGFPFFIPHHAWMGLLCRTWDFLNKGGPLPDNIKGFDLHSLRADPPPPIPIVTDRLLIIGLVLGIKLHIDDLFVVDKR